MERRVTRGKRIKYDKIDYGGEDSEGSRGTSNEIENDDDLRKSRIRDTNKEFAKRMTILQTWQEYWSDYTTREGEAYTKEEAKVILKRTKKINCPIESCRKLFTTLGGLRYHYARCNIERCFKCKVCNPPAEVKTRGDLLRHMIRLHYENMPELNEEQKEIANSFLTSSGRAEKSKTRKTLGDPEMYANARSYVTSYQDLVTRTTELLKSETHVFKDWRPSLRDWEPLISDLDRRRFNPPERESVRFRSHKQNANQSLRIGECVTLDESGTSANKMVFFTGGINTAAAWLSKPYNVDHEIFDECLAIAVNSSPMDHSIMYKDCKDVAGCIQFWKTRLASSSSQDIPGGHMKPSLDFVIGHNYGIISEMAWCPLGTTWERPDQSCADNSSFMPRSGLLALACGDGQIRIICVPHSEQLLMKSHPGHRKCYDNFDNTPMFRVRPIAILMPPGVGSSTDYLTISCTSISWNIDDNQRLIVAGYSNGFVALYDLANFSPIVYSNNDNRQHIHLPFKMWLAHCLPVVGVGISSSDIEQIMIATGSRDRLLKIWNTNDLNSCLTFERAPITKIVWDFRLRGVIAASEAAFTSYQNRVSYRFPTVDGNAGLTISTHRATVWGLANSLPTSAVATSDEAGEVFVAPTGRPPQKRCKSHLDTFSLFTLLPREDKRLNSNIQVITSNQSITIENNEMVSSLSQTKQESLLTNENADPNNEEIDETVDDVQPVDEYNYVEREVANKPSKFLMPIDDRVIETYSDFKQNFSLEFIDYNTRFTRKDQKLPEAWIRASDTNNIYCDRACDYPFSSIRHVVWSPNRTSFSNLLSVTHIGLCRLDRIEVLEQIYKCHLDSIGTAID